MNGTDLGEGGGVVVGEEGDAGQERRTALVAGRDFEVDADKFTT